jgi:hypothetical protein
LGNRAGAGWLACVALLAAASSVWLHRAAVIDLDDATSNEVMFAREPLSRVAFDVPWTDQSPLSFVLLHYWRLWGEGPLAIRALNLLLLAASLLLFYAVARRLCPLPRVAVAAVALAALSPASLWAARGGRMYSLHLLLWVATLYCLVRYSEGKRARDLAGVVITCVLAIYNHFIGFVSTATALAWLVVEALAESRRAPPGDRAEHRRRLLGPPVAAGLAIFVLVQPQVMRMLALLQLPPAVVPGQAVPAGWLPFLNAVSSFLFIAAGWGRFDSQAVLLRSAYLAGIYLLVVMGLARGSARLRRLTLVTVLLPLVMIGMAAGRMDFRPRHLFYLLPLVWLAMANGALGRSSEGLRFPPALARAALAILAGTTVASAWLVHNKLPEGYFEWTKLMQGLVQLRRPGMEVYMAPGPLTGTPTLVASRMAPATLVIQPLSRERRLAFLAQAAEGRDFAFLSQYWSPPDAEYDWRARYLEGLGYRSLALTAPGTTARVFTRGGLPAASEGAATTTLTPGAAGPMRLAAASTLKDHLGGLRVLRTGAAGAGRVDGRWELAPRSATVMHETPGPDGEGGLGARWQLGDAPWDAVGLTRQRSGGEPRSGLWAHPKHGTRLVIEADEASLGRVLEGFYGLTDFSIERALAAGVRRPVGFRVLVDGRPVLARQAHPVRGWQAFTIHLAPRAPATSRLRVEVDAEPDSWAHFVFDLWAR